MFAVGNTVRLADGATYEAFRDKMAALMDAGHPARATVVQAGVDDVASHLRPADPGAPERALVVFPEDVGLVAALIGTRGADARAQTTAPGAIVSLFVPYAGPRGHYNAKYPGLPGIRALVLALTDTLYRSTYETFRDLAVAHGVHLSASINMAPARRVEAASEPALVALLRDPDEPGRTYAYEAIAPTPYNATYVFAPDGSVLVPDGKGGVLRSPDETGGAILPSNAKPYLVEIEQPPPGSGAGLSLAFGAVRDQEVIPTPVGRLAIVTSKPAWMPDVNDRYAAKGANVVLQPEAFSGWGYAAAPWEPDILREGGYNTLQKIPQLLVNVDASLVGNFFDVTFDGQSTIIGRERKADPGPLSATNAWIGQPPSSAFLALGPWIVPDPGIADPTLGVSQRRVLLAASGKNLLPGSGVPCPGALVPGACENGYREAIVHADVDVPDGAITAPTDPVREAPPRFTPSILASGTESPPVSQYAPRAAALKRRVWVVWHDERAGLPNVWLAVASDREPLRFGPPIRLSDNPAGSVAEMHPTIAVRNKRVVVAWQELASGRDDDRGRIKVARFTQTGRKIGADVRIDGDDTSGKWLPVVTFAGPNPVVAWIDERDGGPEGEPLEHVWAAGSRAGGRRFEPAVRIDAGTPVALALHLDNKWSPALAARGRTVYAAWTDFRNYNWDVFFTRSDDGGRTWAPNVRVDDFPGFERIHERPSLAVDRRGRVHVAWADLRAREPDTNVFYSRSVDGGATFAANRQLDDSKQGFDPERDRPTNQWHPSLAADGERLFVAWQDDRLGNPDVFFTTGDAAQGSFAAAERVDDTGAGASAQSRPTLAVGRYGRRTVCWVAWEDDRDGQSDVRVARRDCSASARVQ
jgi:hypothetical protein